MPKRIYIIDGTALAYRSFYAFIRNPLVNSRGENTSTVFGVATSLLRLMKDENPDYLVVAFDSKEPTFRHEMYAEYKATREKMPDEMADSLDRMAQVIEALRIPTVTAPGYEADDIMGTLAERSRREGIDVYLVTGDKDLMQLVDDHVWWYNLKKTGQDSEVLDPRGVREKFGVLPGQVIDVLSLMGDSSDNVPGVPGVGPKTAVKLIEEFRSLDNVYDSLEKISQQSLRVKLAENRELAYLSKDLVTIDRDIPLDVAFESFARREPDGRKVTSLFRELEFNSLIDQFSPAVESRERKRSYRTVLTREALKDLAGSLSERGFVFDLETTGLDPVLAELVGLSFSWVESEAWYLPVTAPDAEISFSRADVIETLRPVLEDESVPKCGHNAKYDIMVLNKYGITVRGLAFDTMIAAHLLKPEPRRYSLDALSRDVLEIVKIPTSALIGTGKNQISMADVPLERIAEYACEDADCTFLLWKKFEPMLNQFGLMKLFTGIEMPLIPVLADMELTGVTVDAGFLKSLSGEMHTVMEETAREIYELAGETFNIGSPQQLGVILFEKLEIQKEVGKKRVKKTKTGYSTDVSVLEQYAGHPLVGKILEYRQYAKLLSTYIDALPKLVNGKTGRIHTSFKQTVAATGRLSSVNPNLQNIPVRTRMGREIRKAFVPRDRTWKILSADYSQIELRLMAHMSGDENMRNAFINGEDIHARTAALIFGIPDTAVTPDMRYRAKAINFGILYGMSPYRLARELSISHLEAQDFITAYFTFFPKVNEFIRNQIERAYSEGYVTTMNGRRRPLPDIRHENQRRRQNAENIAINTPLQGTAAELIKLAMIRLADELKKGGFRAKLLLQIHDELVLEVPGDEVEPVTDVLRDCMVHVMDLSVPLLVDVKTGENWFEAH